MTALLVGVAAIVDLHAAAGACQSFEGAQQAVLLGFIKRVEEQVRQNGDALCLLQGRENVLDGCIVQLRLDIGQTLAKAADVYVERFIHRLDIAVGHKAAGNVHSAKMLWAVAEGHEVFVGADADAQRVELVQDLGNVAAAVGLVAAQHSLKLRAVGVKVQAHDVDLHAALVGGAIKAAELAAAQNAQHGELQAKVAQLGGGITVVVVGIRQIPDAALKSHQAQMRGRILAVGMDGVSVQISVIHRNIPPYQVLRRPAAVVSETPIYPSSGQSGSS